MYNNSWLSKHVKHAHLCDASTRAEFNALVAQAHENAARSSVAVFHNKPIDATMYEESMHITGPVQLLDACMRNIAVVRDLFVLVMATMHVYAIVRGVGVH